MSGTEGRSPGVLGDLRAELPGILAVAAQVVIVLAVGVGVVDLAVTGAGALGYLGPACVLAGTLLSRRRPLPGLALLAAGPMFAWLSAATPVVTWSAVCFAAFVLTVRGMPGLLAGGVLGLSNLLFAGLTAGTIDVRVDSSASIFAAAAAVGAAMGSAVRGTHLYRQEVEARIRDADRARLLAVEHGVATERLRIARDLHDSIGHQIAVVNMHLGAAEVHLSGDPTVVSEDLAAARTGVQEVLRETQQTLQVLRSGDRTENAGSVPGAERIADLVASARDAGMEIDASLGRIDDRLPLQAGIAAHRIAQEALTNAHTHGAGPVRLVAVQDEEGNVTIDVTNRRRADGTAARPGRGGHGIIGMKERAALVGGAVETMADGETFHLHAVLPADELPRTGRSRP